MNQQDYVVKMLGLLSNSHSYKTFSCNHLAKLLKKVKVGVLPHPLMMTPRKGWFHPNKLPPTSIASLKFGRGSFP